MRRKCIPTLLILATIFGLGTKVHLEDFLYKEKDNVTLYIEESKNEKVGNNIENIAGITKDLFEIVVSSIKDKTILKPVEKQTVYIKASQDKLNEIKGISLEKVDLVHIVDGDTLLVVDKEGYQYKVRLIGVDTPESVNRDESKNNQYGDMASDHTKELLKEFETVYLEYDELQNDIYGRLLAYVWTDKDTDNLANMLNARLLYDGFAVDKLYEPNDKYAKDFKKLRKEAEKEERGLWTMLGYKNLVNSESAEDNNIKNLDMAALGE